MMHRYLIFYFAALAALAIFILLPLEITSNYLKGMGELTVDEVIERQQLSRTPCLFGSALRQDNFAYKTALYDRIQPDIVAIGSSRVMQFRSDMFAGSFVNLGGAFGSLAEGEALVKRMLSRHRPKLVLFGIDFWWFNVNYQSAKGAAQARVPASVSPVKQMLATVSWLANGKISLSEVIDGLGGKQQTNCHLGVQAKKTLQGFGPDGSYYYVGLITGQHPSDDVQFVNTISRIRSGNRRFDYGFSVDPAHLQRFRDILSLLKAEQIPTVLFLPPLAPRANEEIHLHREEYAYIPQLRVSLIEAGLAGHDFTDATLLGATACEFVYGVHAGDVSYARILKALSSSPVVRPWVAGDSLNAYLNYSGLAMRPVSQITQEAEVDFLGIGCTKKK